jgi:amino acid adenylation domain-containing protein
LHADPGGCAIRFLDYSITNAAVLDKVLRLAACLPEAGIVRGTRVGVCFERGPETVVALLALWLTGAVYVPLDSTLPRERLLTMCEAAALEVVLTQAALQEFATHLPCAVAVLEPLDFESAPAPAAPAEPLATVDASDLAYILFTSGSSGTPKGVMIAQGNIAALFAAILPLLELPAHFRVLGCANFSFDISLFELLAPLLCGGTLVLADRTSCAHPERLARLIEAERITVIQATPSLWQLLNALPWSAALTLAIATGEALPRTTAAAILQRAPLLWNLYGPTECTLWASAHRVTAQDLDATAPRIVSIGTALRGYELNLRPLPAAHDECAAAAELVISGSGVGIGYCATRHAGSDGFSTGDAGPEYRSGDLCSIDAAGLLHYRGRCDNQVKHQGYRIELDEIAWLLQQHMSISQAACLLCAAITAGASGASGAPCTSTIIHDMPTLLFACVVFKPDMPNRNRTQLNEYLATFLPAWMLPQRYFFLDRLPLTPSGKLDRKTLMQVPHASVRPAGDGSLDARIAAVFCEVLDLDSIGPHDSFLDAGGSSMLAATLVLLLNERLGTTLSLRQALLRPPTVFSIGHLLREKAAQTDRSAW